jgi:hypothetical protein
MDLKIIARSCSPGNLAYSSVGQQRTRTTKIAPEQLDNIQAQDIIVLTLKSLYIQTYATRIGASGRGHT